MAKQVKGRTILLILGTTLGSIFVGIYFFAVPYLHQQPEVIKPEFETSQFQAILKDPQRLYQGRKEFVIRCSSCHGMKGAGISLATNLIDDYWQYGSGNFQDIYNTVWNGLPKKGMPSWKNKLKPQDIQSIVAFVTTLQKN